jgi:hypothetical protein
VGTPTSLGGVQYVDKIVQASNSPRPNQSNGTNGNRRANELRPGRPQQPARGLNQQRTVSTPHLAQRNKALASIASGGSNASEQLRNQVNLKTNGAGISIKGVSTTNYTVIAQNFALGTTAADIEAVLVPDDTDAGLIRCRIIASNPTVIAEVVMTNKEVADEIIATYNNKMVSPGVSSLQDCANVFSRPMVECSMST